MTAMTDQDGQNQGGYVGGFSFGNATQPTTGTPTTGAPAGAQPVQQPVQPVQQPVYNQPTGTQPAYDYGAQQPMAPIQPMQTMPAPQSAQPSAPLGGMADPYNSGNPPPPPFDPNYRFADRMKNWTTSVKIPAHQLKFDEAYFLNLLAGSISLTKDEKKKIVDSVPKLRQEQVDELIRIFEEERAKFIELSPKHGAQLKKLEDEHAADWKDIEISYVATAKKEEEDKKAEEIRKQLGLS